MENLNQWINLCQAVNCVVTQLSLTRRRTICDAGFDDGRLRESSVDCSLIILRCILSPNNADHSFAQAGPEASM